MASYTININTKELLYDIDALTYKTTLTRKDMLQDSIAKESYAIKTDEQELDRALLIRMLNYRDAEIRVVLIRFLSEVDTGESVDTDLDVFKEAYLYDITTKEDWNPQLLKPLAKHIHRYLVYGTLYDYYNKVAPEFAKEFEDTDSIKDEILKILNWRKSNIVIRPLRPF